MHIVVTGVSRGLGRAMTQGIITAGHTVSGCARSNQAIEELRSQFETPHRFDAIDIADAPEVESWAESVINQNGAPDFLINGAAIMNRSAPLWELSSAEFSTIVDVNIKGTHNTIRHFAPAMIEAGQGVIVNFSSYWGQSTSSDVAAYCATKWAIEGLSRGLADDLPPGLASVALNPGVINTEMLQSCFGSGANSYPTADQWAQNSVPYILGLGSADNGQSLTVPGY